MKAATQKVKIVGIIPARFASTRFPGKPLVKLGSKTMIQRVYEQASACEQLNQVIIATDDQRIADHAQQFGAKVVMTRSDHPSGTDRCFEALGQLNESFDYVVNIQGDEPFIQPQQIGSLCQLLNGTTELATQARKIQDLEALFNPNVVKVVLSNQYKALYFSRESIPHQRNQAESDWLKHHDYYQHIGLYAYRTDVLVKISQLAASKLELAESLEQLRWLENGFTIDVGLTSFESIGIDTPDDIKKIEHLLN